MGPGQRIAAQTTEPPASTVGETAPQEAENPAATTPATTQAAPPPPRVESNVAEEVHIHGYDKYVQVPADGSARTRFTADAEGIFEIEAHSTGELLAKLQVSP